jgi:hypothetical protein
MNPVMVYGTVAALPGQSASRDISCGLHFLPREEKSDSEARYVDASRFQRERAGARHPGKYGDATSEVPAQGPSTTWTSH